MCCAARKKHVETILRLETLCQGQRWTKSAAGSEERPTPCPQPAMSDSGQAAVDLQSTPTGFIVSAAAQDVEVDAASRILEADREGTTQLQLIPLTTASAHRTRKVSADAIRFLTGAGWETVPLELRSWLRHALFSSRKRTAQTGIRAHCA